MLSKATNVIDINESMRFRDILLSEQMSESMKLECVECGYVLDQSAGDQLNVFNSIDYDPVKGEDVYTCESCVSSIRDRALRWFCQAMLTAVSICVVVSVVLVSMFMGVGKL